MQEGQAIGGDRGTAVVTIPRPAARLRQGRNNMMATRLILGAVAGALVGLGYYKLVGCPTGACPLTRSPWITTLYGAAIGVLLAWGAR